MIDLATKQAFWCEQLPNFEAKYWLPSHFEFLIFDKDQGNYVIKEDLDPSFEDEATEIFHRVNTGWAMWKKAINFNDQQAEIDSLKAENAALKERLQKIEDGEFVVVPKSEIGNYYFDDSECIYIDEPDSFLSELDVGEVCEVKRRDYFDLPTQYAAKVFIDIDNIEWRLFESELEAEIAANECKDKFWGEQGDGDE